MTLTSELLIFRPHLDALQGEIRLVDIEGLGRELVPLLLEHLFSL